MEEELKRIEKEIEEKELDLEIKRNEGYTDNSQEVKEIIKERDALYEKRWDIIIGEYLKEVDKEIEEKELDLAIKRNEGYTDDSKEVKAIIEERDALYQKRNEVATTRKLPKDQRTTTKQPEPPKKDPATAQPEPSKPEGISKDEIRARIEKYKAQQREMWENGADNLSDAERREFDRINNVMGILQELLNKNPKSEFVSLEDISNIIRDNKQKMGLMKNGKNVNSQETEKLNDIVNELEDISKGKEASQESPQPSKPEEEPIITEGIPKDEIRARIEKYKAQQREMWEMGADNLSDAERREFDRINNVMGILQELLNKNPKSEFVSLEDISNIIRDNKQKMGLMKNGKNVNSQETEKLNDIVNELEDISKGKEASQESPQPSKPEEEPIITEGIPKDEIRARIEKYRAQQKEMWEMGADNLSDAERREYERINNVVGNLEEWLKKYPKSEFIPVEDINSMIYDYEQEIKDIWREVSARGDGATMEESSRLTKLSDIVAEWKDILKVKENENPQKKEPQPPVEKFPRLDLKINKKTGEAILIQNGDKIHPFVTYMDAWDYSKEGQENCIKTIQENEGISDEDKRYLENVDPTIYNAYLEWERAVDPQNTKYGKSAAEMYVKAVIAREKNLEAGKELENVEMPGKVTVDIGWHPRRKNQRPEDVEKFSLKNLWASRKADKILRHHAPKHMDLAEVKSNRGKWVALVGTIGALLTGGAISKLGPGKDVPKEPTSTETELNVGKENTESTEKPDHNPTVKTEDKKQDKTEDKTQDKKQDKNTPAQDKQEQTDRIYPGDCATMEQYSQTFNSSDAKQPDGVITDINQKYGVNKLAVVIGDQIYSTDKYSADELYEMAQSNPEASMMAHVDKAMEMDGRMVVETNEKGNPSPIYIYNDNGTAKTSDGRIWDGDVQYGCGWMNIKDLTKVQQNEMKQENPTKVQEPQQEQKKQSQSKDSKSTMEFASQTQQNTNSQVVSETPTPKETPVREVNHAQKEGMFAEGAKKETQRSEKVPMENRGEDSMFVEEEIDIRRRF